MIGKEDGKISEAITRYIVALYWQSPLLHFESSAFAFFPNDKGPTEGSEISQKPVRNQSETSQKPAKRNLSLSLAYSLTLLPEILRLLLFQFPLPLPLLLVLLVLTVSFPTDSGPRKLILLPSLKQCVHAWILTLITRLAITHTRCYCTTTTTSTPRNFCLCF